MQRAGPRLALGAGGGDKNNRELVNGNRYQRLINGNAVQTRSAHAQVGDRFAARFTRVYHSDVAAHGAQNLDDRRAGRVHADVFQQQRALRRNQRRDKEKCR